MSGTYIHLYVSREIRRMLDLLKQFFMVSDDVEVVRRAISLAYEVASLKNKFALVCPACGRAVTLREAYAPFSDSDGRHIAFKCPECGYEEEIDLVHE